MKEKFSSKQLEILSLMEIGETADIHTSQYDAENPNWKPKILSTKQAVLGLIKRGYLEGETFWRGARVTRIK